MSRYSNGIDTTKVVKTGDTMTGDLLITSGNVGIGTASPGSGKLQIQNSTASLPSIYINHDDPANWAIEIHSDGYGLCIKLDSNVTDTNPILKLDNSAGEVFRVQENGSVGIGQAPTSTVAKFEIVISGVPTAADNAAAATAGVAVGGLYRTNADPSVVCIRSA